MKYKRKDNAIYIFHLIELVYCTYNCNQCVPHSHSHFIHNTRNQKRNGKKSKQKEKIVDHSWHFQEANDPCRVRWRVITLTCTHAWVFFCVKIIHISARVLSSISIICVYVCVVASSEVIFMLIFLWCDIIINNFFCYGSYDFVVVIWITCNEEA